MCILYILCYKTQLLPRWGYGHQIFNKILLLFLTMFINNLIPLIPLEERKQLLCLLEKETEKEKNMCWLASCQPDHKSTSLNFKDLSNNLDNSPIMFDIRLN